MRRSTDLAPDEQRHVRTALRFLVARLGGRAKLASALRLAVSTVDDACYSASRRPSSAMAIRAARVAGVSVEDVLDGFPAPGACPLCGRSGMRLLGTGGHEPAISLAGGRSGVISFRPKVGEEPKKDAEAVALAAPSGSSSLGVEISGHVQTDRGILGMSARATGLAAVALISAVSVLGILFLGDPEHKPAHFVAALLSVYVAGIITHAIVGHGRLSDALKEKDHYRNEMERVAAAKRTCEETLLRGRLSSAPPGPKKGTG